MIKTPVRGGKVKKDETIIRKNIGIKVEIEMVTRGIRKITRRRVVFMFHQGTMT